jgi:hypothetical protein
VGEEAIARWLKNVQRLAECFGGMIKKAESFLISE